MLIRSICNSNYWQHTSFLSLKCNQYGNIIKREKQIWSYKLVRLRWFQKYSKFRSCCVPNFMSKYRYICQILKSTHFTVNSKLWSSNIYLCKNKVQILIYVKRSNTKECQTSQFTHWSVSTLNAHIFIFLIQLTFLEICTDQQTVCNSYVWSGDIQIHLLTLLSPLLYSLHHLHRLLGVSLLSFYCYYSTMSSGRVTLPHPHPLHNLLLTPFHSLPSTSSCQSLSFLSLWKKKKKILSRLPAAREQTGRGSWPGKLTIR